ncbi:MAG TPA: biopolymer transporter ExbD [Parachlamydiaceae bacterium]|nr:biopolymer transporter ExbD [Parachlamydiaceae bacterium]
MSRRPFRLSSSQAIEEPTVNLTPLIDVVFVILIAFIVIAPLLELDHVELANAAIASQDDQSISVQETSPISIHVKQDNTVALNGQLVALGELPHSLAILKERYPNAKPQLFHDRKAHFGTYQTIKNAAESAGFQQMDVILKPS